MAIDSRIALALDPINIGERFGQNIQNLRNVDILNQQRALAPLQQEQEQLRTDLLRTQTGQALSPTGQALTAQEQMNQLDLANAQSLKPALDSGNQLAIISQLTRQRENAVNFGLPQSELDEIDQAIQIAQTPEGIQSLSQATNDFITRSGGGAKQFALQSNAPITDPVTGQVSTPVFDPATGQTKLVPIEGAIQETPTQKAAREQKAAQSAAELEIKTTQRKETIKRTVARTSDMKKEFSERRKLAARSNRKVREAQKLASKAAQGLTGVSKVQLGRLFPGIDTRDEAALTGAFKSLALDELQKFKGPTTDFEFRVTEDIAGSLGDGAFANQARLASLERANWFMDRESKQFNDHIKAGHDPDEFFFNINELVTPKKGGKSYSLQSLQDTAVANHISIDEVIKRLAK